jgi:hypothetical protein
MKLVLNEIVVLKCCSNYLRQQHQAPQNTMGYTLRRPLMHRPLLLERGYYTFEKTDDKKSIIKPKLETVMIDRNVT